MSETHNTVIVGNKMFRYRKEQHLATDPPLDRHELSVNELFHQLAEAKDEVESYKYDNQVLIDTISDCLNKMSSRECFEVLTQIVEHYDQLKEKGE